MTEIYTANLTHWDREWYFSSQDAMVLSDQVFSDALAELEEHSEANFCLDGQTSILEDYLRIHPEKEPEIRKLVANKQLFIGPWYTQSDCLLVDGESLIRNAMIGMRDARKLGGGMRVGYIPDSFGFNAQMPTILKQAGLNSFVFWRGIDYAKQVDSPYFTWQGLGNESVTAMNMPLGYGCAPNMETTSKYIDGRLNPYVNFIQRHSSKMPDKILLPAGGDQQTVVHDIKNKLATLSAKGSNHYRISSFPEFADLLSGEKLPHYTGEFRLPAYARIHRTISSVRTDLKLANYRAEQKMLKVAEPLTVMAKKFDIELSSELLVLAWKKILKSQAHDSLGGCVYDTVADDIKHRLKEASEIADGIENIVLSRLSSKLGLSENQVLVVNTQPEQETRYYQVRVVTPTKQISFGEDVEDAYISNCQTVQGREHILTENPEGKTYGDEPTYYILDIMVKTTVAGLGYRVLNFHHDAKASLAEWRSEQGALSVSSGDVEISFHNGEIEFKQGEQVTKNALYFVDSRNDGDTYDYSPAEGDQEKKLSFASATSSTTGKLQRLTVYGSTEFTDARHGSIAYNLSIESDNVPGQFRVVVKVNNQAASHRLRLVVNPSVANSDVFSGLIAGSLKNNFVDYNGIENYPEFPSPTNVCDKFVALGNQKKSCYVFTGGLKEYEEKHDKLYITLFSTTGEFGKPNLLWRPGRASGDTTNQGHVMIQTPKAQLFGAYQVTIGLQFKPDKYADVEAQRFVDQCQAANISYQVQTYNRFINRLDNKIQKLPQAPLKAQNDGILDLEGIFVSAIYPSLYSKDGYVVRIVNPSNQTIQVDPNLFPEGKPQPVNALEEPSEKGFSVGPHDMLSVLVKSQGDDVNED